MPAAFDSPATARLRRRTPSPPPEPGRAEGDCGTTVVVDHTGELLELRLSETVVSRGSDKVTAEVLALYDQAFQRAQSNAVPAPKPGELPRRR